MVKQQIVQQIIFYHELFSKHIETNHFIKRMMQWMNEQAFQFVSNIK